jgi:hypothetical protein
MLSMSSPAMAAGLSGHVTVNLIASGGVTSDGGTTVDATPANLSYTITVSPASIKITGLHVPGEIITSLTYLVGDNFGNSGTNGLAGLPLASFIPFRLDLQTTLVTEPGSAAMVLGARASTEV